MRAGAAWQRLAGAVAAAVPVGEGPLDARLEAAGAAALDARGPEVAAVRARAAAGIAALAGGPEARGPEARGPEARGPGAGGPGAGADEPFDGADALAALAEAVLAEARGRAWGGATGATRVAAAVDRRLPTDAVELMDRPETPEATRAELVAALDGWNRRFGNYERFCAAILPELRPGDTVLDLASGHGGFAAHLQARAPDCRVIASDVAPVPRADGLAWRALDARRLAAELRPGEVDAIVCTSALHHFGAGGAAVLLAQALARARTVVVIDLARRPDALVLGAAIAAAAGSPELAHDTALSFRRAFRPAELRAIARLVPGGERVTVRAWAPGFVVVRAG